MTLPKTLVLDIETFPLESYTWGLFDQNISLDMIKTEWSIAAFAAKWLGKRPVMYKDTRWQKDVKNDNALLEDIWHLLNEADIVVAQNGASFDIKRINAKLVIHGFPPYSPIRIVDTLLAAKKHFGFTSNKLAWTSQYLTDTPKSEHKKFPGFSLWKECLEGNVRAWNEMRKYNIRDVQATEKLYLKLRPWISSHPNVGAYIDEEQHNCPNCGSTHVTKQGTNVTQQGRRQQYQCQSCSAWSHGKAQIISPQRRKALLKT